MKQIRVLSPPANNLFSITVLIADVANYKYPVSIAGLETSKTKT